MNADQHNDFLKHIADQVHELAANPVNRVRFEQCLVQFECQVLNYKNREITNPNSKRLRPHLEFSDNNTPLYQIIPDDESKALIVKKINLCNYEITDFEKIRNAYVLMIAIHEYIFQDSDKRPPEIAYFPATLPNPQSA